MQENLQYYHEYPNQYFSEIKNLCNGYRYIRFHSAGDIPDAEYFERMIALAKSVDTNFFVPTKKFEIVNECSLIIPNNLHVVLSAWGNFIPENPKGLPMAYVRLKDHEGDEYIPSYAHECIGNCTLCTGNPETSCFRIQCGQAVVFNLH